jgi:hypothetical protein
MSAPSYVLNDDWAHVITLSRNNESISHIFRDHYITFHEVEENGKGMLYYIVAHNYGTGEEEIVFFKDKDEFEAVRKEASRDANEAGSFNKKVKDYTERNVGKDFVKAVKAALARRVAEAEADAEALRCIKFCEEEGVKAEIAYEARRATWPVVPCFFGVEPRISDEDLKDLCCKPLEAKTDPLKLKELEERFPGATMVLSTPSQQGVIKYVYEDLYVDASANHKIACDFAGPLPWPNFAMLGVVAGKRPQLMAEWRGMYIDLSHLF